MKKRNELSAREIEEVQLMLARRIGDTSVPTLPQVAMKVIDLVSSESSTIADFTKVIQSDQALSGRLLRMANSAYYAQSTPVTRIDRAMVLLGLEKLKAVALGFHLSKALLEAEGGFSYKRQWTQSLFRAWFSLHVVNSFGCKVSGEAFLIGLLCDAGVPLMPQLVGDRFEQMVTPNMSPHKRFNIESNELMFTHVDVAVAMSRVWKLPKLIAKPISLHHTKPARPEANSPESVLLATAYLAGTMAIDPDNPDTNTMPAKTTGVDLFDFTPEQIEDLVRAAGRDFTASREMFEGMIDASLGIDSIVEKANTYLNESVEGLVEDLMDAEQGQDAVKLFAGGLNFELSKGEGQSKGKVQVVISDEKGNRLLSEQIEAAQLTDDDISEALLLSEATPDEANNVLNSVRNLAA